MAFNRTQTWKPSKLADICVQITDGKHADCQDHAGSGFYFLSCKDVSNGKLNYEGARQITEVDFIDTHRRTKFAPGDVLVTNSGTIGRMAIAPDNDVTRRTTFQKSVAILKPIVGLVEPSFLYYALQSDIRRLIEFSGGTAQKNLLLRDLRAFEIPLPPLPIQRRIAGILSAYDELIENSQRRIKILESMARALYREWFVHFRFPGHESIPKVNSPLGEIPQGWEVRALADLCESVSYGYTASASRDDVGPKFLRITDIVPDLIDWAGVPFCEISEDKASKYLLRPGDIVVARTGATTGYAKRLNKLHPSTVFASYLVRVRTKAGVSNRMLGILMESDNYKQFIKTNIGGAAQPQANAGVLTSIRVATPSIPIAERFDKMVEPIIDEAELLAIKIQNLRRTRDLLLPRLLSGQIDVEAMD
jgi:type I restriction enzyme, S subunit